MTFELNKVPFYKAVDLFENEKYQEAFEEFLKCAKVGNLYAPYFIRHMIEHVPTLTVSAEHNALIESFKELFELIPSAEHRADAWLKASLLIMQFKTADAQQKRKILANLESLQQDAPNAVLFLYNHKRQEIANLLAQGSKNIQAQSKELLKICTRLIDTADLYILHHMRELGSQNILKIPSQIAAEIAAIDKYAALAYNPKRAGDVERLFSKFYMGSDMKGSTFEADLHRMYQWQRRAGYLGCKEIQLMFYGSTQKKRTEKERFQWLSLAAKQGDPQSQIMLAQHYFLHGSAFTPKDEVRARILLEQGIAAKTKESNYPIDIMVGWAARTLGKMQEDGLGGLSPDPVKALEIYQKAASYKDSVALYNIGIFCEYGRGGLPKSSQAAVAYYEKSLEAIDDTIYLIDSFKDSVHDILGDFYLFGREDFEASPEKAIVHAKIASKSFDRSKRNYAILLYQREKVPKNQDLAIHYFVEAADLGNEDARKDLLNLFAEDKINGALKKKYGLTLEKMESYLNPVRVTDEFLKAKIKFYFNHRLDTKKKELFDTCLFAESKGLKDIFLSL